jgi:RNA-directed DNA polymerase
MKEGPSRAGSQVQVSSYRKLRRLRAVVVFVPAVHCRHGRGPVQTRVRELTGRHRGVSLERMIGELVPYLRGWAGYFSFSQSYELPSLDGWIRRRLRCVAWLQWKTRGQRYRELRRLNVPERSASAAIFSPKGPWRLSFSEALHRGFTKARFRRLGLPPMEKLACA